MLLSRGTPGNADVEGPTRTTEAAWSKQFQASHAPLHLIRSTIQISTLKSGHAQRVTPPGVTGFGNSSDSDTGPQRARTDSEAVQALETEKRSNGADHDGCWSKHDSDTW